jgi:hypothetical protein
MPPNDFRGFCYVLIKEKGRPFAPSFFISGVPTATAVPPTINHNQPEVSPMPSYAWSVRIPDDLKTAVETLARRQHRTTAE